MTYQGFFFWYNKSKVYIFYSVFPPSGSEKINTWSSSLYLRGLHRPPNKPTTLFYELCWQQSLEKFEKYRYYLSMGINLRISNHFSLQSSMAYTFERVVASTIKQYDFMWNWGLFYNMNTL